MNRYGLFGFIVVGAAVAGAVLPTQARSRRGGDATYGGVPRLNVEGSCADAQKFSSGDDKNTAYKGCIQDETNAKTELGKRWSSFKVKDRSNCVEQARFPSPSYVEVLTCLEMDSDAMKGGGQRSGGKSAPQIGGPVAPGLSGTPEH